MNNTSFAGKMGKLSSLEHKMLRLIADGRCSTEIAQTLDLSPNEMAACRHGIMEKLGIDSMARLSLFCLIWKCSFPEVAAPDREVKQGL